MDRGDVACGRLMVIRRLESEWKKLCDVDAWQLVVKVPGQRADELVVDGKGEYFEPRRDGRLMKEWLVFAGETPNMGRTRRRAYRFVRVRSSAVTDTLVGAKTVASQPAR